MTDHILDGTPSDIVNRYESLADFAEHTDFGILDDNVVVIDTETTGLSFTRDELIQIAAARMRDGKVVDWYVTFVNPGQFLTEDIIQLTHIHDEDLVGAPDPDEALRGLAQFVGDALVVAHNAAFDKNFCTKHPGGYPLLQNIWLDSLDLSRIALPRLKSHRLLDLVRAFGAPTSTHRADDDVAATCVVYRILLAAVAKMPGSLVAAIGNMAPQEEWATGYAFREMARMQEEGFGIAAERAVGVDEAVGVVTRVDEADGASGASGTDGASGADAANAAGEDAGQPGSAVSTLQGEAAVVPQNVLTESAEGASGELDAPAQPMSDFDRMMDSLKAQAQAQAEADTAQSTAAQPNAAPLFSVHAMRKRRVLTLPTRFARKDADDLVGQLRFPAKEDIDQAFSCEGVLGGIYADYEPRQEQRSMAQAIRDAMESSENLAVEAGTGVGKSMAYLVPAALFALANEVGVGVATKTNSLLDQLVYQELPALSHALQKQFGESAALTWAPLKGMSHYPCLRKISRLVDNGPSMREVAGKPMSQAPVLAAVLSYVEQSEYDDMDSLKADYRVLPRYALTCKSSECLRRKCPFFGKLCFVHGARRRAEMADIIVTNHSLLFCDLAADGGLLPPVRHWVVDEAHSAENEARQAFAETVDSEAVARLIDRLNDSSGARNVFTRVERAVQGAQGEQLTLLFGLLTKARMAGGDFARVAGEYLMRVKDLLYFDPVKRSRKGQSYEQVDVWINAEVRSTQVFADVAGCVHELIEVSDKLIRAASDVVAYLEGIDEAAVAQREVASCVMELRDVRNAAELIYETAPDNYAYQAVLFKKKDRHTDRVQALLLDVGDKMNETLYTRTHSVVYASATLTVGNKFDSFASAVGLNRSEFSTARTLELPSSYDFDNNMIVYVVSDMPEPNDPAYLDQLNKLLVAAHIAQRGSMLTLFTNRREMERCYDAVAPDLKREDLRLVCQRYGVSVKGLRDDFLADEHLSLFALKSFWEGFDAPGATLKGVVIPKLPFARPTDPLYCERASRDDRAWWHYVLPQAVIETKQAAGRLIRKADDHGVLILADRRLITKAYGKTFLKSLQSKTVRVCTADEIVRALGMMASW